MGLEPVRRARAENPKAHDLFLAGRALWATRERTKILEAIGLFEQAIAVDPNDALAYMGLADAYGLMTMNVQIGAQEGILKGEKAAAKALELDPKLAEAHAAMGMLKVAQWDWKTADDEYRRAIELNPSYDRAYVRAGVVRFYLGDFAAAERLIREAEALNPYALSLPLIRAEVYYYSRRYSEEEALVRAVQVAEPKDAGEHALTLAMLAPCLDAERRFNEAVEAARAAAAGDESFTMNLAETLHAAGREKESAALLAEAVRANANNPYRLAIAFARLGDREKALAYLQTALEARVPDLPSVRWEPAFDALREDGRYQAIVARIFPSRS
jgi:tetratricopeptide (TPR) repeat protein